MKEFKFFIFEKSILGLIENIRIDGIGDISAKLDTGNGAYNVLHGEDIDMNGEDVTFTTVDGITLHKPIQDTITINVGAGNTEERPVVLFNVVIGGKQFPNVPFSIGNRADNDHKVLISKTFIQNDLNALIDVSLKNVADRHLQSN